MSSGLRDVGYVNFNVDAGWAHDGQFYGRGSNGTLVPNPKLFPDGMKAFCDEIHRRGLLCGLYTGFAPMVCGFMNGSWGYESVDAQTFAGWGVDTLKNDWCYNKQDAIEAAAPSAFAKMRDALNATGRRIIYAIHGKGGPAWATYYRDAPSIANSWRMGGDIEGPMHPSWAGILRLIDSEIADNTTGISGPNAWNDCDMMVVGQGLSAVEDRAHVSMWAMLASPMILGYDLRNASDNLALIAALKHPGILSISQDALARQATLVPPRVSSSAPNKLLCLGSLGIYGTDPERLTHLVPCGGQGVPAVSRWAYDSATRQLRYEGVTGQPRQPPHHSDVCLAAPSLPPSPRSPHQQLNATPCSAPNAGGWTFGADGVLSVGRERSVANLSSGTNHSGVCINVWECSTGGEVVYYPCTPLGEGKCEGEAIFHDKN